MRAITKTGWGLVSLAVLATLGTAACSAGRPASPAAGPTSPKPVSAETIKPTPAASPLASTSSSPASEVDVQLAGIPATITAGETVSFTATMVNTGAVTLSDVAPLFQIVGGPCNCAQGSLERLDTASGTWQAAPMPEGDGDPNYLALATGPVTLAPGSAVTVEYQLTLSALNPLKALTAVLFAVQLPAGTQLAMTTAQTQLIAG